MTENLTPHFEDVQAHYDLSDDFFRLFLDPTMTYSCAYFDRLRPISLEEAQIRKMDLSLGKLGLRPGMTLLDVGCGWGATSRRAIEKYDVNVIGLTLSEHQAAHVQKSFDAMDTPRSRRVLLRGWEQFDESADRIVSIGAFEHFGYDRYDDFFAMAYRTLPGDGVMLLHTITMLTAQQIVERGLPMTEEQTSFNDFIAREIFPGASCPRSKWWSSTPRRWDSTWPAASHCDCTTPGRWTIGPSHWPNAMTTRSGSSPKRYISAICGI